MFRLFLSVWLLAVASPGAFGFAQSGVELEVSSDRDWQRQNADRFDAGETSGSLTVTITNHRDSPIVIPTNYDGKIFRLHASGSQGTRIPLVLYKARSIGGMGMQGERPGQTGAGVDTITLHQGQSQKVLEIAWKEILDTPIDVFSTTPESDRNGDRVAWGWLWQARSAADFSPLQKRKNDPRKSHAVFWLEYQLNGQTLRSAPLMLTTKR